MSKTNETYETHQIQLILLILSRIVTVKQHHSQNVEKSQRGNLKSPLRMHIAFNTDINSGCCKEQYFRGTWNRGKLEVVKEELARVNIHILGISELKWTGMG